MARRLAATIIGEASEEMSFVKHKLVKIEAKVASNGVRQPLRKCLARLLFLLALRLLAEFFEFFGNLLASFFSFSENRLPVFALDHNAYAFSFSR